MIMSVWEKGFHQRGSHGSFENAQCEDIIAKLLKGVDTVIGSQGTYVSGGEAQRLSIARAMLKMRRS